MVKQNLQKKLYLIQPFSNINCIDLIYYIWICINRKLLLKKENYILLWHNMYSEYLLYIVQICLYKLCVLDYELIRTIFFQKFIYSL